MLTRRPGLVRAACLALLAAATAFCATGERPQAAAPAPSERLPNIIILYADDLGYGDLASYGARGIPTPAMDRLAREGVRFTDAHATAATCTPSRYALLTGEYGFRSRAEILPGDAPALTANNLSVGDVFLCSGQSNMQWSMRETAMPDNERRVAIDKTISLISVPIATARSEQRAFAAPATWSNAFEGSADFSAVCLIAGRAIANAQKVPVGLIDASMGGTPIEAWLPYDGLKAASLPVSIRRWCAIAGARRRSATCLTPSSVLCQPSNCR